MNSDIRSEEQVQGESEVSWIAPLTRKNLVTPSNPKVWAFAILMKVGELPVVRQLKSFITAVFVDLAPSVPVSLRRSITGSAGPQAFLVGAVVTLIFCLFVPLVWTFLLERHIGRDPGEIFFLQDTTNLILYSLICPLYVGLGCWMIVTAVTGYSQVKGYAAEIGTDAQEVPRHSVVRSTLLVVLILSMAFFSTAIYIEDIIDQGNVQQRYWFMEVAESGEHTLGALGAYYFLINFCLLIVTLVSITVFMSMFVSAMEVGRALEQRGDKGTAEFETLKTKLATFVEVYILAKALTFAYMINFYLWKGSPLGATQNIYTAYVFLALFGVLFVSFPRYFVELQWFRLVVRSGQATTGEETYHDIRPFGIVVGATLLDTVMISGFILGVGSDFLLNVFG